LIPESKFVRIGSIGVLMDIRSEIKKLARIEASPYPFFSLYLNTRWDSEQQRERIRLFVKNQLKKGMEEVKKKENWEKLFPEDQQRIERFVEGLVRRSYEEEVDGVAMFSCSANDLFLTYPSIIPFENQFFIADQPVLSPLYACPPNIRIPLRSWSRRIQRNFLK